MLEVTLMSLYEEKQSVADYTKYADDRKEIIRKKT
jgi:hypothetical protein